MPGSSVLVIDSVLDPLSKGSKKECQHIRVLLRVFLDVTQESLDLNFRTLIWQMRKGTGLCTALECIEIVEGLLLVLWKEIDESRGTFSRSPKGRKWVGWLYLECSHVRPTRDEVG